MSSGLGAVGVEAVEEAGDAVLAGGGFEIVVMTDVAHDADGGAGGVGPDDEADAVGQRGVRRLDVVFRDGELVQSGSRPLWQGDGLGGGGGDLLAAAEAFGGDRLAAGHGLEDGGDGAGSKEVLPGDAVDVGNGDLADGVDILLGRGAAFGGERGGPGAGEAGDGVALELGLRDLTADGGGDEVFRHAFLRVAGEDGLHLRESGGRVDA
jgi:hypothetical protein